MSTKEEQAEAIGDAMVAKIRAETRRASAEEAKFLAEEKKLYAEAALLKVQRERKIQDRDVFFPLIEPKMIAETSKLVAEGDYYREKADAQSFVLQKDRELHERLERRKREEEAEKS